MTNPQPRIPSRRSWNAGWFYVEQMAKTMRERGKDMIDLAKLEAGPFDPEEPGMPKGKGVSDPVGSEAVKRVMGDIPRDEVAMWLGELFAAAQLVRGKSSECERLVFLVDHRADERVGRQVAGADCVNCRRYVSGAVSDRLRAGRCSECDQRWRRYRKAEAEAGRVASDVVFHNTYYDGKYLA